MSQFESIKADYQITDLVERIDLARILRENAKMGRQVVTIVTPYAFVTFLKNGITKRIKKAGLMKVNDVVDDGPYGFSNDKTDQKSEVMGNVIRSIGFTSYLTGPVSVAESMSNLPEVLAQFEADLVAKREAELEFAEVVKVLAV